MHAFPVVPVTTLRLGLVVPAAPVIPMRIKKALDVEVPTPSFPLPRPMRRNGPVRERHRK
jgi:hypothetical protein